MYNDKTLYYMKHTLYRLEKTKITFKYYWPNDSKLCRPSFKYSKFYTISYFIQYIRDYSSAINYNTAHSEVTQKYLLKIFYNKINKKEYDLLIWQYNIRYINIIVIKDVFIKENARDKEGLLEEIANITLPVKMAWALSFINLVRKYMWVISNIDLDAAKELRLTGIKKYWKHIEQVEIELDWLHDWISALATFVRD